MFLVCVTVARGWLQQPSTGLHDGTAIASEDLMQYSPEIRQEATYSPDKALGPLSRQVFDRVSYDADLTHLLDRSQVAAALPQPRSCP